jgi:hypothetical protein
LSNERITQRFQDWLLSPRESLDFEVKGWLDLDNAEHRGLVAKALIALEKHGGGHLLIGYREGTGTRGGVAGQYALDGLPFVEVRKANC